MNKDKLSSDEVPQKFAEWLLSMGCPAEKVPSVDKLSEMCRGQYYMVWRDMMEHVHPKDIVRNQRLQVFCDDVLRCQKKNTFQKTESSVVVPEELSLWRQQSELRDKVAAAEARVKESQQRLNQLVDKVSSKLSHRNITRSQLTSGQRRAWLLQQVADELRAKQANLLDTRAIAQSFRCTEPVTDIESKLDKYTARQCSKVQASTSMLISNPLASSSITSNNGDLNESEDQLTSLVRCPGSVLWPLLCERRSALTTALVTTENHKHSTNNRARPQWILSNTAGLQCALALDALKHRSHIVQVRKQLANALLNFKDLSEESRELLVVRCERARTDARVNALRMLHDELTGSSGAFAADDGVVGDVTADKQIPLVDKAIESKRDELKRLLTSLSVTERKVQSVRECLINAFNSFHTQVFTENDRFGDRLCLPQESMLNIRQFYEDRRERRKSKVDLSMDLDVSDNCSFTDITDNQQPKFYDELKIYLKKFDLEKNRKLVLENGEKIWIFETLQSSIERYHKKWQADDVTSSLICPSVSLSKNLQRVTQAVQDKEELENLVKNLENVHKKDVVIDINSTMEEEQLILDKIKKRLNENLQSLMKTTKTLDLGQENLKLWADNNVKKYISCNRTIEGKSYEECEAYFKDNLSV